MELRHLRYFVAVAETENFHRAAERLNLVQSALSHQIRDLERELGVDLFERRGRGIALTPTGALFLAEAQGILGSVARASERARRASRGQLGTLKVGFQPVVARHRMIPAAFNAFRSENRAVELQLLPMTTTPQVEALQRGEIEAALLYLPAEQPGLETLRICVDDWLLAVPAHHRLARRPVVRMQDLVDEDFVWFPRSASTDWYDRWINRCMAAGFVPRVVQESVEEGLLLNLVAAGMGVYFALSTLRAQKPAGVVLKQVADFSMPMDLDLVWRASNRSPLLRRFIATVERLRDAGD
jgi:DNA-binding transcriptional LysR family regulator